MSTPKTHVITIRVSLEERLNLQQQHTDWSKESKEIISLSEFLRRRLAGEI